MGVTEERDSAALGTSPEFWLKMQLQYELWLAKRSKLPKIRRFPHLKQPASASA